MWQKSDYFFLLFTWIFCGYSLCGFFVESLALFLLKTDTCTFFRVFHYALNKSRFQGLYAWYTVLQMFTAKKFLNKHQVIPHLKKKTHKKHFNSLCLIEFNELLGSFSLFFFFFGICERFLFQQLMNHRMQGIVQVEREDWRNCWFILIRFKFQDFNFFVLRFRLKNTSKNYCTNQGVFCLTSNKGSSQFSSVLFNFLLW